MMDVAGMKVRRAVKQMELDRLDAERDALAAEIDELNHSINGHYARQIDDGRPVRIEMVMES